MGSMMIHKAWAVNVGNADDYRKAAGVMDRHDAEQAADARRSASARTSMT